MAIVQLEDGRIADEFEIGEEPHVLRDALVMTPDAYALLSADDIAAMTDVELYELVYVHLDDNMRAVARFICGASVQDVVIEDIVGNAWMRAWKYLPRWRDQTLNSEHKAIRDQAGQYLRGWLSQICSSQAYDYLRRRQLELRHVFTYDQYDDHVVDAIDLAYIERHETDDDGLDTVTLKEVITAMSVLSEHQRQVIWLSAAGYSQDEVAERLSMTRVAVKACLFRARRHLRKATRWED